MANAHEQMEDYDRPYIFDNAVQPTAPSLFTLPVMVIRDEQQFYPGSRFRRLVFRDNSAFTHMRSVT
jgi:hypothetical protein